MGYGQYSQDGPAGHQNPLEDKPKTKRQRHVFPTSEIAHLWAHQTQEDARNAQGNFYFDGPTIYSYGSHFPIASHVTKGRKKAILLTTRGYSPTTSGHISAVRGSIPSSTTVFNVPNVMPEAWAGDLKHDANMQSFLEESRAAYEKATRGRKYGESNLEDAFDIRNDARTYAKFFKVKMPRFGFLPIGVKLESLQTKLRERKAKAKAADAVREQAEETRRAERQRIRTLELAEKLELWRNGDSNVSTWDLHGAAPALRIKGDEVETSLGARVPLEHAKKALQFVRKVKNCGQEFVSNGHTFHIGHYSVDRIEADGTLHAGCHVIPWPEIERLAPRLEA